MPVKRQDAADVLEQQADPVRAVGDRRRKAEEDEDRDEDAEEAEGDEEDEPETEDDGISGTWEGTVTSAEFPPGGLSFTLYLSVESDGACSGSLSFPDGSATIDSCTYDFGSGGLSFSMTDDGGAIWEVTARVSGSSMSGTLSFLLII